MLIPQTDAYPESAYLLLDVLERIWRVDREADQDDVRIGVRERSETIVILLASGIPQGQLDVLAIDLDIGDVILENGRNVDLKHTRVPSIFLFVHTTCRGPVRVFAPES